ncbi:IS66 family insertion sequence element accessory protein TnpB [Pseudotabrizicola sediminis]|uniref:IS66 family insertion sequence element accessory protein TnpB n=1 Tax=Pseudotabrizicola sediminis TaxID=2486418 RepID=UPI00338D4C65
MEGTAAFAQNTIRQKPTSGAVFAIRGRRGDRLKLLLWDGRGLPLLHGDGAESLRRRRGSPDLGAARHAALLQQSHLPP